MKADLMKKQWDQMAKENPFFSITSWPDFENKVNVNLDFFWEIGRIHAQNLLSYARIKNTANLTMTEIGCGIGRMTHYFSKKFKKVYALDISEEMIEQAKQYWKHLNNVEFFIGSGYDLQPIKDNCSDVVFSFYVFNHIIDPEIVLSYIKDTSRILKSGGKALLHFRISKDYPLYRKSIFKLIRLYLRGFRPKGTKDLWWNKGISKISRDYKTPLIEDFGKLESWHGSEVSWGKFLEVCSYNRLKMLNHDSALTTETQFVFVTLQKV